MLIAMYTFWAKSSFHNNSFKMCTFILWPPMLECFECHLNERVCSFCGFSGTFFTLVIVFWKFQPVNKYEVCSNTLKVIWLGQGWVFWWLATILEPVVLSQHHSHTNTDWHAAQKMWKILNHTKKSHRERKVVKKRKTELCAKWNEGFACFYFP